MTWPFVVRCIFAVFAVFRLARMITLEDGPFQMFTRIRAFLGRLVTDGKNDFWWTLAELFNCPHCMGIWVTAIIMWFVIYPEPVGDIFLIFFAIAGAQSYLVGRSSE